LHQAPNCVIRTRPRECQCNARRHVVPIIVLARRQSPLERGIGEQLRFEL
jgi:hypothetical protein